MRRENNHIASAAMASNLQKCLSGELGYKILINRLTHNQSNFQSSYLTDVVKKVGVKEIWTAICDDASVEDWTGEARLDSRVTRLTSSWNEIFDERNIIVHRVSQASGWSAQRINGALDTFAFVIRRLAKCLEADAEKRLQKSVAKQNAREDGSTDVHLTSPSEAVSKMME